MSNRRIAAVTLLLLACYVATVLLIFITAKGPAQ